MLREEEREMKVITELQDMYVGKTVEITKEGVELLEAPDVGMRAVVTHITERENDFKFTLNFEVHRSFNEKMAQRNFYDKNGSPTLTWFESDYRDGILDFYLSEEELEDNRIGFEYYFHVFENNQTIEDTAGFEGWWNSTYKGKFPSHMLLIEESFKEVALKAWNQAKLEKEK